jgi:DNA-binding winged helix-turn-helix (wHTH) protein
MSSNLTPPRVISFGPFEVDLRTQELKKHGTRLRLVGQPFQILRMLLRQPGELVTREELKRELWSEDTHVDFERGVNMAVNRLRETLGDSVERPRLIETLPRRGYRFIGQITSPPPLPETGPTMVPLVDKTTSDAPGRSHVHTILHWVKVGSWCLLGLACVVVGIFFYRKGSSPTDVSEAPIPFTDYPGFESCPHFLRMERAWHLPGTEVQSREPPTCMCGRSKMRTYCA